MKGKPVGGQRADRMILEPYITRLTAKAYNLSRLAFDVASRTGVDCTPLTPTAHCLSPCRN